jgi:acetolactate synthase-1/2/3 large subunit
MLLALKESSTIKTVIVRNEQGASFMACGYAMFSDKPGVCFATGGPGAFNLFSGLAVAYYDSLPVVAITGYTSAGQRGKGALNESTGQHRTPDSMAMFAATTKRSYIIEDPADTCDILEDALNTAFTGRPGPVHIHVPKDVTVMPVENFRELAIQVDPVLPDEKDVETVARVLADAIRADKTVGVIIGYGCLRSHAEDVLRSFVDRFQLPFMTTMDAKGALPENHPLSVGMYGTSGDPGALAFMDAADVVLALGNSFAQNATFAFKPDVYDGKTLLHVNIDPDEIDKVYKADCGMVSDIKPAVEAIHRRLDGLVGEVAPRVLQKDKTIDQPIEYDGDRIHPGALCKVLSDNLPADSIVLGDAGSHMLWLCDYMSLEQNQRYQNPGSFGPMASHTNGAIGVKCAHPDRVVVSGSGDGCYQMAGFELMTAVQYDIPVIWVIFNNGEFNVIKKFLINMYGKHAFMQFDNPDFVAYAKACGADGYRVQKLEEFEPAFRKALASGRPTLIDVHVESEVYPPFHLGKV